MMCSDLHHQYHNTTDTSLSPPYYFTTTMSNNNSAAEGSKPANATQAAPTSKPAETSAKKIPQLGALEDDDEFEVCHSLPGCRTERDVKDSR
jgi:hypothetical protein